MVSTMEFIKKNIFLIISIVFAATAGLLVYVFVNASAPNIPVVVAAKNLAVGTEISITDVTVKNLPQSAVPSTSFKNPGKLIGQTITVGPVVNGDIIRGEHLSTASSLMATLRTMAPEGWAALELPANSGLGLSGLRRGDKVNLFGEVGIASGSIVDTLVEGAIILNTPNKENETKNYVVAVPPEYAKVIAEKNVRNRPVVIVLPERVIEQTGKIPQQANNQAEKEAQ